jgi:hypothetical protein
MHYLPNLPQGAGGVPREGDPGPGQGRRRSGQGRHPGVRGNSPIALVGNRREGEVREEAARPATFILSASPPAVPPTVPSDEFGLHEPPIYSITD